jgi:aldehyde:ferredoxin oxidoreductase
MVLTTTPLRAPTSVEVNRYLVDLSAEEARFEPSRCEDVEDALGGIARATKMLGGLAISDPYDPGAPLIMNLGVLSGSRVMTALRTFFHGYSPLKTSKSGAPGLMWTTGSGDFGTRLRGLGVDEVVFTGRCEHPVIVRISAGEGDCGGASFTFLDGSDLAGKTTNERIQLLHGRFPEAHFAVIGPAGEHYLAVRYAGIALSTEAQLDSGDPKMRYCGRGGFGGVMGSKNLLAICADGPEPKVSARGLKEINREINLGKGSLPYREASVGSGTWRLVGVLHPLGALPEYNFVPQGTHDGERLVRASVERGPYVLKAEGCHLCGIRCHKNIYAASDGQAGEFRTKVDYEPLALLSSNLGIYEPDSALELIRLVDELGLDSISVGVVLGYAMEWNRRHPSEPIAGGLAFGDVGGTAEAIEGIAGGRLPELGQGVMRLAEQMGEASYAMHSKGVEYPAYLPQINPSYPWALAGGHMSMRTYLLAVNERETGVDYWVDATVNRGHRFILDDITGLCKFSFISADMEAEALRIAAGLDVSEEELLDAVDRTFLRGYASERRQGFEQADYTLPADSHLPLDHISLPYFNTPEFFAELQQRVLATLDKRARAAGFMPG